MCVLKNRTQQAEKSTKLSFSQGQAILSSIFAYFPPKKRPEKGQRQPKVN
jgi:hypothetical protein